jgi:X-linked retinitis pigmentosa GTPase regulator
VPEKEPDVQPSTSQQVEPPKVQRIRNIPKKQRDYLVDLEKETATTTAKVNESKTCFDFKEDESDVQGLRGRSKKKNSEESTIKPEESDERKLENLDAEMENIMNETKVPEIPLELDSSKLHKENELEKRNLPPKERNKRIFKSKSRKLTKEEELSQKQEEIVPEIPTPDPPIVQPEIKTDHLLQIPKKKHLRSLRANLEIPEIPVVPAIPEPPPKTTKHETRLPKKRKTSPIEDKQEIEPEIVAPALLELEDGKSRVERSRKTPEKPKQKIKATAAQPIYITKQGFLTETLSPDGKHENRVIITESMIIATANNCSSSQMEEVAQTSTTNSTKTRTTPKKDTPELVEIELIDLPDKIFQTPEKLELVGKVQEIVVEEKMEDVIEITENYEDLIEESEIAVVEVDSPEKTEEIEDLIIEIEEPEEPEIIVQNEEVSEQPTPEEPQEAEVSVDCPEDPAILIEEAEVPDNAPKDEIIEVENKEFIEGN